MYEYPYLIWWMAVPFAEEKSDFSEAKRLAPIPFKKWSDVLTYKNDEIMFYGEDNAGSGLIEARARIALLDGALFVVFDNQFYELRAETIISYFMLELTEGVPMPALYSIRLHGADADEDSLIVVTGDSCIHDIEVTPQEIAGMSAELRKSVSYNRDYYLLVRRPTNS